jgi:protein-tyrosine phosphatase
MYLGDINSAQNVSKLLKNRIGAVLTCAAHTNLKYPNDFKHMIINANDTPSFNLGRFFNKGINFISEHLKHTNVYVHCFAGVSRSGAMTIAYMMKKENMTLPQAMKYV